MIYKELWKQVPFFENCYEVSNFGNLRSLDRTIKHKTKTNFYKGKDVNVGVSSNGYKSYVFYNNGYRKSHTIHRLVANLFIDNPNNKNQVNHIDGNKLNNHFSNLEWCTHQENSTHAKENNLTKAKKVVMYVNGVPQLIFDSITEASIQTNTTLTNIAKCSRGLIRQAGGYNWELLKESK